MAPWPEDLEIDRLAASFGALPSNVREEDEVDLMLRKVALTAIKQAQDAAGAEAEAAAAARARGG